MHPHRRFARITGLLAAVMLALGPAPVTASAEPAAAADHPTLSGSFIQPHLVDAWSDAELADEMQYLLRAGMDEVVLQWSADTGSYTTAYPTSIPLFDQNTETDVVGRILTAADDAGVRVHLGLQVNDEWWDTYANDANWLTVEARHATNIAGELWSRYGHHASVAGWYLPFEVDNHNFPSRRSWDAMSAFYVNVITGLRNIRDMPVSTSPFYNIDGGLSPTGWKNMWVRILNRADLDVIALQDGVGVGHASVQNLPAWFRATLAAIDTARPTTQLYSDVETFNPDFTPMAVKGVVADMRAVQPFVDGYWSFSYDHYNSPQVVSSVHDSAYRAYVSTGAVDDIAPTTPASVTVTRHAAGTATITWAAATDAGGVAGYNVVRDGTFLGRVDAPRNCARFSIGNEDCTAPKAPTWFQDVSPVGGVEHSYTVTSFDAAGNLSAASAPGTEPSADSVKVVSGGAAYQCSIPASSSYPDSGGELTDGALGSAVYTHPAWSGRLTHQSIVCVLDLGTQQDVSAVTARSLQDVGTGIAAPALAEVAVSLDGTTFTPFGGAAAADEVVGVGAVVHRVEGSASARFVRFTFTTGGSWAFLDELEVLSGQAGGN